MAVDINGVIHPGDVKQVARVDLPSAGSNEYKLTTSADTVLVSLFVESVSGDLDVTVHTVGLDGQELEVIAFPTISAPTTELFLKKAAVTLDNIRVRTSHTDAAKFDIRIKGLSSGELETKILGAGDWEASQKDIGTTREVLIPISFTDRAGLVIKNYSKNRILFVAESEAKLIAGEGYPIEAGQQLGMDLSAGASIWAVSSSGTVDVRILEAGG